MKAALLEAILPYCAPTDSKVTARGASRRGSVHLAPPIAKRSATLTPGQWRRIGREVTTLHEAYTRSGAVFAHESNPIHANMAGYQFYFLPRNVHRVYSVLQELPWAQEALPKGSASAAGLLDPWCETEGSGSVLPVLDLGCGTGAFSLALLSWLSSLGGSGAPLPRLDLYLVDQGHTLLGLAESNIRGFAARALPNLELRIEARANGVERFLAEERPSRKFSLVGAAMMLNELNLLGPRRVGTRSVRFAESLRRFVRDAGAVVMVEPGTRKGYMNLMAVRDQWISQSIVYPCPHGGPCPLWSPRVRDWCHATRPLPPGFFFDAELRRLGHVAFEMRELNLAGLAVQRVDKGGVKPPFRALETGRIVSAPMASRNRPRAPGPVPPEEKVVWECAPDGQLHERPAKGWARFARGARSRPARGQGAT